MENSFPTDSQHQDHSEAAPSASGASEQALAPESHSGADHSGHEKSDYADGSAELYQNPASEHHEEGGGDSIHADQNAAQGSDDSSPESDSTETPAHHPAAESHVEAPVEPGTLAFYAMRARKGRLNAAEEAEATRLLREALLGGRAEVAQAVAATPSLPWVVTVQATTAVWPEIKPTFRSQFLAGLARTPGESAARVRLSLARGLHKVDPIAALKLIILTLKMLRNKETGLLEGKGASIFANVLIGRGKAWVLQLQTADLKPAELDLLTFSALHGAFHQPQPPLTQLSLIKWACASERLAKLPEALLQMILKGVTRWSSKWQAVLRREVSPLPDAWVEVLKSPASKGPHGRNERGGHSHEQTDSEGSGQEEASEGHENHAESEAEESEDREEGGSSNHSGHRDDAHAEGSGEEGEEAEDDEDAEEQEEDESGDAEGPEGESRRHRERKQRPVYVSKTVPAQGHQSGAHPQKRERNGAPFNLQETLRQVESYVNGLRGELQTAQRQLRQREDDRRSRRPERPPAVSNPGELSVEELIRLNQQLEFRNAELQARIDDLTIDSEVRAASRGLITDAQPPDPNTELRTLLGFKLKEDREDFLALEQEARDLVVQQHYRTVLRHVFEVLDAEGIQFPVSE